jgi:RNA polymerase sigma-54 factor
MTIMVRPSLQHSSLIRPAIRKPAVSQPSQREASAEREQEVPNSPSEVDDDRWASDAGTFTGAGRDEDDDSDPQDIHSGSTSLRDHLGWQLGMTQLSERDRELVRFLIDALDDDGYLSTPMAELWETLPPEYEIEIEELDIALRLIQNFDPIGIGARNPQECLACYSLRPCRPTKSVIWRADCCR